MNLWLEKKIEHLNALIHNAIKDGADDDELCEFDGHWMRLHEVRQLCAGLEYLALKL